MVGNNESKDINNKIYPCFYFDDRININGTVTQNI